MKKVEKKRLIVDMPEHLKVELEEFSDEVGMSQNQLVVLAVHSLVANYKTKGSFIFADLLNPVHREK